MSPPDPLRTAAGQRREILRLALPAFLALVAEPLFLLADSAIVGHLGTASLAALGVASSVLLTAAGIFVFLAYATTSVVARQIGAGAPGDAISAGIDGLWLSVGLGVVTGAVVGGLAAPISGLFGASAAAHEQAVTYLGISAYGIPGMLVVLAVTGVLRGFQDTRTPLVTAVAGFSANIVLNLLFVYGFRWGIAGSAWGTVISQVGMAAVLSAVLLRRARALEVRLHPHPARILAAARGGLPLLVRTLALRAVLVLTTWVVAGFGDVALAGHQVAMTVWSFLAFALDAIAIAAQALTGKALGAGDGRLARELTATMLRWGLLAGAALGLLLLLGQTLVGRGFTSDATVLEVIRWALVVVALGQPLAGYVFVLDGVLIGAGDGRWLAGAMVLTLLVYAVLLAVAQVVTRQAAGTLGGLLLVPVWVAFSGFMLVRATALGLRLRGEGWLVTGAVR